MNRLMAISILASAMSVIGCETSEAQRRQDAMDENRPTNSDVQPTDTQQGELRGGQGRSGSSDSTTRARAISQSNRSAPGSVDSSNTNARDNGRELEAARNPRGDGGMGGGMDAGAYLDGAPQRPDPMNRY